MDEQEVVKGIVSLSDILQALVLTNGDDGETVENLCLYLLMHFIIKINVNWFVHADSYLKHFKYMYTYANIVF